MTYYNRIKEVEAELPSIHTNFSGEIMMEAFKGVEFPKGSGIIYEIAGTRRCVQPWVDNIILDQGLEHFYYLGGQGLGASGGTMDQCIIGTSSQAESASDTGCVAPIAYASQNYPSPPYGAASVAPYYGWKEHKYRFIAGFGGGNVNINEASFAFSIAGTLSQRNAVSTSRALTRDGDGDPSSVAVLEDEYLDVYYRRRMYPGHITESTGVPTDTTGSIDIAGVTYNYTIRPAQVATASRWGAFVGNTFSVVSIGYGKGTVYSDDVTIGAVTELPSAIDEESIFYTNNSGYEDYVATSLNQTAWLELPLDSGNTTDGVTPGIRGIFINSSMGMYQMVLDKVIPKDNTKILRWFQNFSWARHTIS